MNDEILNHLKQDDKLAFIIDQCTLTIHKEPIKVFDDLLRSIVSQQLSTSAAATIDTSHNISQQILNLNIEQLRSVGLSAQKAQYIQNVCRHFDENTLHDTNWDTWSDEDIIAELTKIKGVGKWTVEMILMFSLHRPDVLPLDDLIIRTKMVELYGVTSEKKALIEDLIQIAESWRPYRSYACRYLWASKDLKL
jgi:DNA-3-methyladenine glycosylase II